MPKVEELKITGAKGETLFHWPHAVCVEGENPLVVVNGEVKEVMGKSPVAPLGGPTVVLRSTPRCSGPDAAPLLALINRN